MTNKYLSPNTAAYSVGNDNRTGLGYVQTDSGKTYNYKHTAGGTGSPLSMGDALSKPVGEYDPNHPDNIDDDLENEFDQEALSDFNSKHNDVSGHRKADDSLSKKGTNPFYYVGSATSLRAGYVNDKAEIMVEDNLKSYIKSFLYEYTVQTRNRGRSMSGRQYVANDPNNDLGDMYPPHNVHAPMSPTGRSYNVNRTTQKAGRSADGVHSMNKNRVDSLIDDLFGDDDKFYYSDEHEEDGTKTSWEAFGYRLGEEGKVDRDEENVRYHNKKF